MLGLADRTRVIDLFEALMRGDMAGGAERAARPIRLRRRSGGGAVRPRRVHAFRHAREGRAGGRRRSRRWPRPSARAAARFAAALSMRVLSRTWQMLLKGIAEVQEAGKPLAAAEMVLVRIAYAADLPTPDEVIRDTRQNGGRRRAPRRQWRRRLGTRRALAPRSDAPRGAPRAALGARAARQRAGAGISARCAPSPAAAADAAASATLRGADRAREREARHPDEDGAGARRAAGAHARTASSRSRSSRARARRWSTICRASSPSGPAGAGWWWCRASRARRRCSRRPRRSTSELEHGVRADPLVQAVLARFPGAEIVGVRRRDDCATADADAACRRRRAAAQSATTTARDDDEQVTTMADFLGMMKQAAQLQSKMQAMQAELDQIEVEGTAGGGLVTVTLTGQGRPEGRAHRRLAAQAGREGDPRGPDRRRACRRAPQGRGAAAGEDEERLTGGLPLPPGD